MGAQRPGPRPPVSGTMAFSHSGHLASWWLIAGRMSRTEGWGERVRHWVTCVCPIGARLLEATEWSLWRVTPQVGTVCRGKTCDLAGGCCCESYHFLDCDDHCCPVCLIFNSYVLLKHQNVCANLRILYRLTMDLCSKLKARHPIPCGTGAFAHWPPSCPSPAPALTGGIPLASRMCRQQTWNARARVTGVTLKGESR